MAKRKKRFEKGRSVRFTHPETGKVIEGPVEGYTRDGRVKIRQLTGIQTPPKNADPSAPREYMFNETIWTVPKHIAVEYSYVVER